MHLDWQGGKKNQAIIIHRRQMEYIENIKQWAKKVTRTNK